MDLSSSGLIIDIVWQKIACFTNFKLNFSETDLCFIITFVNCPRKDFKLSLQSIFEMSLPMSVRGYPLAVNFKSVSWESLLSNISGGSYKVRE